MPISVQRQCKTAIGDTGRDVGDDWNVYPAPIVNEQESAKIAKAKVAAVRKLESTKAMANQVYTKHGSRNRRREGINGEKPKALSRYADTEDPAKQQKISTMFASRPKTNVTTGIKVTTSVAKGVGTSQARKQQGRAQLSIKQHLSTTERELCPAQKRRKTAVDTSEHNKSWSCKACTFLNDKPLGLACSMCATPRN